MCTMMQSRTTAATYMRSSSEVLFHGGWSTVIEEGARGVGLEPRGIVPFCVSKRNGSHSILLMFIYESEK